MHAFDQTFRKSLDLNDFEDGFESTFFWKAGVLPNADLLHHPHISSHVFLRFPSLITSMSYSLFLGTGLVGQLEIFSGLCIRALRNGQPLEEAIASIYPRVKEIAREANTGDQNPFCGYGGGTGSFDSEFERFHPIELYQYFAKHVVPFLPTPLVCVDGNAASHSYFSRLISGLDLAGIIQPKRMNFKTKKEGNMKTFWDISEPVQSVLEFVNENGYPSFICGAHFLAISSHTMSEDYGGTHLYRKIPHHAVTEIMGNQTKALFIEEGDLIFDEGITYFLHRYPQTDPEKTENGIAYFQEHAATFFKLKDEHHRRFSTQVFPAEFLKNYNRRIRDFGQVLVSIRVEPSLIQTPSSL